MARLPYLDVEDLGPDDQDLVEGGNNLMRVLAHSPGGARVFGDLGLWMREDSALDARLRELAILAIGYVADADYVISRHTKIGRDVGLSEDDIRAAKAITKGVDDVSDPPTRAVLRVAREMALDGGASDETFRQLKVHLNEEGIVDLLIAIGFYCGVVRMLKSLDVEVEDHYLS